MRERNARGTEKRERVDDVEFDLSPSLAPPSSSLPPPQHRRGSLKLHKGRWVVVEAAAGAERDEVRRTSCESVVQEEEESEDEDEENFLRCPSPGGNEDQDPRVDISPAPAPLANFLHSPFIPPRSFLSVCMPPPTPLDEDDDERDWTPPPRSAPSDSTLLPPSSSNPPPPPECTLPPTPSFPSELTSPPLPLALSFDSTHLSKSLSGKNEKDNNEGSKGETGWAMLCRISQSVLPGQE